MSPDSLRDKHTPFTYFIPISFQIHLYAQTNPKGYRIDEISISNQLRISQCKSFIIIINK